MPHRVPTRYCTRTHLVGTYSEKYHNIVYFSFNAPKRKIRAFPALLWPAEATKNDQAPQTTASLPPEPRNETAPGAPRHVQTMSTLLDFQMVCCPDAPLDYDWEAGEFKADNPGRTG